VTLAPPPAADPQPGRSSAGLAGHQHPPGQEGHFSERERRVSWEELTVARILVSEGHRVRALKDGPGHGKTADFDVCGIKTEVKTLEPGATSATLVNAIKRGRQQGEELIVNATSSGLQRHWAERGVERFAGLGELGKMERLRVIGAGFDISYTGADLTRRLERGGPELGIVR
jgi:Contact-dependent growth inhibition CdiA C-terminal domain